ncbi:NineTeen Complex (NTC) component [Blastocladiella emersonii ATCC 22665]|nr:NineTeen Complex (NTC) component [Blastocladiella emersonii ATCC 22665]
MQSTPYQRTAKVKNKNPAEVQITAEQLLREAHDRSEPAYSVPKQQIADADELNEYRRHKRESFENAIRRNKHHVAHWLKYAAWEESQRDLGRARSVYERVLEIDPRNPAIWVKYAEMEMRGKNVNLARNLWDRAVTQLPRVDQFWYKYAYMEEMLNNMAKARQIFERWMDWRPHEDAWEAYVAFELRYRELDRARALYRRLVECHPDPRNWITFAKFEEDHQNPAAARQVFEEAVAYLGDDHVTPTLLAAFAKFETRQKEYERARAIYQYALSTLPKSQTADVYRAYTNFEKQWGGRSDIEQVVASKRRWVYEDEVKANPHNVDVWLDLIRLEEDAGDVDRARDAYERAVAHIPPAHEKRLWRRYVYLWLQYAVFEEARARDVDRARAVYEAALQLVPHREFTFAKLWLAFARFLIRHRDLPGARRTLGMALGVCAKPRLFKGYIDLELQLREFDRVRTLYEKFIEFNPANVFAWIKYAELETMLGDRDRARALFELAVDQPVLDMPEVLWKAYIDFEMDEGEWTKTRHLYERLLQRTAHVKVWISFAKFEMQAEELDDVAARATRARAVFDNAYKKLKERAANEERVILLESWRDFEREFGSRESASKVDGMFPRIVKRRRRVGDTRPLAAGEDARGALTEEFLDYLWPDDDAHKPNLTLLAKAQQWKLAMQRKKAAEAAAAAAAGGAGQEDVEEEQPASADGEGEGAMDLDAGDDDDDAAGFANDEDDE